MAKLKGTPFTYVIGARVARHMITGLPISAVKDERMGQVTLQRADQPLWHRPKPASIELHFKSEAARRRTIEKVQAQGKTVADLEKADLPLQAYAAPGDIVRVPTYSGVPMILATRARAVMRRDQRRAA